MFWFNVNQVELMRKAIRPFTNMGGRASANINYSPHFIMLESSNSDFSLTVLLLIKSESFEKFVCDEQEGCKGINPTFLRNVLNFHAGPEWSATIFYDDDDVLHLFFENNTRGIERSHQIRLLDEAPYDRRDIRHLGFEFKAVVGIRSDYFRNNMCLLSGCGLLVDVHITHNKLKLSTRHFKGRKEFVLTKEIEECIIGGVAENEQPIEFSFSLEHMTAYHNASVMSSRVWLLIPHLPEDPFVLNCPVGLVGNIMFLFPRNI